MLRGDLDKDTICALSTPPGRSGIAVVRVSGPNATSVTKTIAPFLPEKLESHRAYFGTLRSNIKSAENHLIDEVLVTYFQNGNSFTGESTVEISCHGNPLIVSSILKELVQAGARPADRGEFTYRAFMNGRIDLTQAESVLQMIEGRTEKATQQALRQLQGSVFKELEKAESDITWALAHLEAGIDFSTEGIDLVQNEQLTDKLQNAHQQITSLTETYKKGRLLKEGIKAAIVGVPNVGKSSLLNALVGDERAIVTDVPGTTRDLIEASTIIKGNLFQFVDTAGIRESIDKVEKIGIERSKTTLENSDLILFVFDSSKDTSQEELDIISGLDLKKTTFIANKSDLLTTSTQERANQFLSQINRENVELVFVSTLESSTVEALANKLAQAVDLGQLEDQAVLTQARQYESLMLAVKNLQSGIELVDQGLGAELIAIELKEALIRLQETIGKRFDDQIMDRVFKEFCIGK